MNSRLLDCQPQACVAAAKGYEYIPHQHIHEGPASLYLSCSCSAGACLRSVLGAILGGAPATDMKMLERIGLLCGRSFQIRDDIAELLSSEKQVQKTFLADFKASKKTILLWYFLQKAGPSDRRLCCDIFSRKRKKPTDLKIIKSLFISYGVALDAELEIQRMVRSTLRAAQNLLFSPAAKSALAELIKIIAVRGEAV